MSCGELTGDLKTNREGGLTKHGGVRMCLCKDSEK